MTNPLISQSQFVQLTYQSQLVATGEFKQDGNSFTVSHMRFGSPDAFTGDTAHPMAQKYPFQGTTSDGRTFANCWIQTADTTQDKLTLSNVQFIFEYEM